MFYYYIWNTDKERLAKEIITKQAETKLKNIWCTEFKKIAMNIKLYLMENT